MSRWDLARQEIATLVKRAKKSGKKDVTSISSEALARIAEKHDLDAGEIGTVLYDVWRCNV